MNKTTVGKHTASENITAEDAAKAISWVICDNIETGCEVKIFGVGGVSYNQGILYPVYRCFPNRQSVQPFIQQVRLSMCNRLKMPEEMIEISNEEYDDA